MPYRFRGVKLVVLSSKLVFAVRPPTASRPLFQLSHLSFIFVGATSRSKLLVILTLPKWLGLCGTCLSYLLVYVNLFYIYKFAGYPNFLSMTCFPVVGMCISTHPSELNFSSGVDIKVSTFTSRNVLADLRCGFGSTRCGF